jgi:UDP-glucose 4-epimerase
MFEKVSGQSLNYTIGPRRAGDVIAIYANNEKAVNELEWNPAYNLEDMMRTAWEWEKKLKG